MDSVLAPLGDISSVPLSRTQKAGCACAVGRGPPYAGPVFTPLDGSLYI
ncbi:hypothetical protein HMPREF9080_00649 [Cardiobacterium valvarum F0432]|uniref:Uncharacterized protein n=1 Tax=Cardiobacterium valvarum F0432 TaxID=797473 RepID=G9ZD16_9GAMM|nr:hypothetical protein HMPREF9080_00649 [Cardiobacterium valvarum F0432]